MILEVCTGSLESVIAACKGGADRVEICAALSEGGLTPSFGQMKASITYAHQHGVKANVLIRPREGDFLYTSEEKQIILDDIVLAEKLGADGVVVGALKADGTIDTEFCAAMRQTAGCMEMTFHRAIDMCENAMEALFLLIDLGYDRVLTSGQEATAEEGIDMLRAMICETGGRIIIMPGCGVNHRNAKMIMEETGAKEIHASAKQNVCSLMQFRRLGVEMGNPEKDEYSRVVTSESEVKAIKNSIMKK